MPLDNHPPGGAQQLELLPDPAADPARTRGLRRRRRRPPMPAIAPTALPDQLALAAAVLALVTRVRSVRVATGAIAPSRLYDLRAFKTVWAEYAYVYRLAAGGRHGGTAVTSMGQLVQGLARELYPGWTMTSYWEDRDRHQSSVRRRLSTLAAMGLLRWTIGVDEDLEERHTLLELLPVPELLPDELAAAHARLALWAGRYDPDLNTGSELGDHTIGVHDVRRVAAPLSASERQRRGCLRARQRGAAHRLASSSLTNSAPPFGTPPEAENNTGALSQANDDSNACSTRTCVTRPSVNEDSDVAAAVSAVKTARRGSGTGPPAGILHDTEALLARVAAARDAREPVLDVIAQQVTARTQELSEWRLEREWPRSRLTEAWACARYGARWVARHGSAAGGRITTDDYRRLRRAVARYERYAAARPEGFPGGGLAALLHLGGLADAEGERAPRLLGYAIGRFSQITKRMRAIAKVADPARAEHAIGTATSRRTPEPPIPRGAGGFFPVRDVWPRWLERDADGRPFLLDGQLQVNECHLTWPGYTHPTYHAVLRDLFLLCYGRLGANVDGAAQMASRCAHLSGASAEHAPAGPYPRRGRNDVEETPAGQRERGDRDVQELARRTGMSLTAARGASIKTRNAVLTEQRRLDTEAIRREALEAFPAVEAGS